jgi:hypothetical protein
VLTSTSRTAQARKPAWQFTDAERIALRTNAVLARQRVAEERKRRTRAGIHPANVAGQELRTRSMAVTQNSSCQLKFPAISSNQHSSRGRETRFVISQPRQSETPVFRPIFGNDSIRGLPSMLRTSALKAIWLQAFPK